LLVIDPRPYRRCYDSAWLNLARASRRRNSSPKRRTNTERNADRGQAISREESNADHAARRRQRRVRAAADGGGEATQSAH